MKKLFTTALVTLLLTSNAQAFTSTKYLDKLIKIDIERVETIVGAEKVTTITRVETDHNGNAKTTVTKEVEPITDSEYLRVLEQVKNNTARIEVLEELYAAIETQIEDLRQEQINQKASYDLIASEITPLRQEIAELDPKVEELKNQVIDLETELANLKRGIATHFAQINSVQGKLADAKTKLLVLLGSKNELQNKLAMYISDLNSMFQNMKNYFEVLERAVTQRAEAIESAMAAKNLELQDLEAQGLTMTQEYLDALSDLTTLNAEYSQALTQLEELKLEFDEHKHIIDGIQTGTPYDPSV